MVVLENSGERLRCGWKKQGSVECRNEKDTNKTVEGTRGKITEQRNGDQEEFLVDVKH